MLRSAIPLERIRAGVLAVLFAAGMAIPMSGLTTSKAHAATERPLAAYSFDKMAGQQLFDESGNGNDCLSDDPTNSYVKLDAGRYSKSLFSEWGFSVNCKNKNITPSNAITVMTWVKVDSMNSMSRYSIAAMNKGERVNPSWNLSSSGSTKYYSGTIDTTSGSVTVSSNTPVLGGVWQHIAMAYDGSSVKLYLDGSLKDSKTATGQIKYSATPTDLLLFKDINGENDMTGFIDDLRIYGSALSPSDIETLMNTPVQNNSTHTYNRSITMSTALPSATNVTYSVSFRADQKYTLNTMLMDFCSNSPLSGQTCTAPGGFSVGAPPGVSNLRLNGTAVGGAWTASAQNSGRTLVYSSPTGVNVAPDDLLTFDITTVTNPNTISRFYARMFTYNFTSASYSATSTDNFKETGGVALGTTDKMGVTFQVPEILSFCVYKVTCGDVPSVVLGHGLRKALDSTQIDTDTAKFSIATNAAMGADVYGHGKLLSLPNIAGADIDQILPDASKATMTAGKEAFGIRISPVSGVVTANTHYADTGGDDYSFDSNQIVATSRYTQQTTPGPFTSQELTITFAATVSPSTPAGWYSTQITLIAVATF